MMLIQIFGLVIGVTLLALGRRYFWLLTSGIGFLIFLNVVSNPATDLPGWASYVSAIAFGLLGAAIAPFLYTAAVLLFGFLAGGGIVFGMFQLFEIEMGKFFWILFLLGGLVGFALTIKFIDWALIILTSSVGSTIIAQNLSKLHPMSPWTSLSMFSVLIVVGIVVQYMIWRRDKEIQADVKQID
jgi:hypothetical protein